MSIFINNLWLINILYFLNVVQEIMFNFLFLLSLFFHFFRSPFLSSVSVIPSFVFHAEFAFIGSASVMQLVLHEKKLNILLIHSKIK